MPDGDSKWLSSRVGYRASENLKFELGCAHLCVDDGSINHAAATVSRLVGEFESSADVLGLSGQYLS